MFRYNYSLMHGQDSVLILNNLSIPTIKLTCLHPRIFSMVLMASVRDFPLVVVDIILAQL